MRVRNIIYYIVFLAVWSFACFSCGKITYEGFENDDVKVYIDCGPDDTVRTYKVMMSRLINSPGRLQNRLMHRDSEDRRVLCLCISGRYISL